MRVYGHVQWISAGRMQVVTDCMPLDVCSPISIAFDLSRVPLSDYRGVRAGSAVLVEAVVSHEEGRHHLMATSIIPVEEWQAP